MTLEFQTPGNVCTPLGPNPSTALSRSSACTSHTPVPPTCTKSSNQPNLAPAGDNQLPAEPDRAQWKLNLCFTGSRNEPRAPFSFPHPLHDSLFTKFTGNDFVTAMILWCCPSQGDNNKPGILPTPKNCYHPKSQITKRN